MLTFSPEFGSAQQVASAPHLSCHSELHVGRRRVTREENPNLDLPKTLGEEAKFDRLVDLQAKKLNGIPLAAGVRVRL